MTLNKSDQLKHSGCQAFLAYTHIYVISTDIKKEKKVRQVPTRKTIIIIKLFTFNSKKKQPFNSKSL